MRDFDAFVRKHTRVRPVPFCPEIHVHTATEMDPIWRATETWLADANVGIPFWCVPWAGGQGIARYVLDHPEIVRGKRVIDFGTGGGLVAIAALKAGASEVYGVDIDPFAIAACRLNMKKNGVRFRAECIDIVGTAVDADVLLAGDVWYEAGPAARFAEWFATLGCEVITGDPSRAYPPKSATELAVYEVPTTVELESAESRTTRVLRIVR